ncbi:peptide chain release factor 2 [Buchnera aphidicola (Kurisakia onigurumii)]|uniref:peptide chain release factor 2 n=1 Tax=Buchnera aphidicola TaxID=9 RepID=UPI0031B67591
MNIYLKKIKKKIKNLKKKEILIKDFFEYEKKKNRIEEIHLELSNPIYWKKKDFIKNKNIEYTNLQKIIDLIDNIQKKINEIDILIKNKFNTKKLFTKNLIQEKINTVKKKIKKIEFYKMFSKKNDFLDCYIDIQPGSGGIDAQDWAKILMRMYLKWIKSKGLTYSIIQQTNSENIGIKSATIMVLGAYSFGWLRTETGIHRLVRRSPFNSTKKRHTSFCSIFVYPKLDKNDVIQINSSDLRIDVYKSSGSGGQHVNKTESAVRITHIPTGIVTQSQNSRSQHKNKSQALEQIRYKINQIEIQNKKHEKKENEKNKSEICWGNQIRSYIFDNPRIKDLRTGVETRKIQEVLNGNIEKFIISNLKLEV